MFVKLTDSRVWVIGGMITVLTIGFILDLTEHSNSGLPIRALDSKSSLTIGSPKPNNLAGQIINTDIPTEVTNTSLQSAASSPEQSSNQNLQSDVNINSPAYANNALVQSLQNANSQ